jgi:N-acetylglucosaminyl-diphospho-decaprenol L-rhamnosyltransferase
MQKRSSSKKVSIVSVTHNSDAVIEKCLASIPDGIRAYVVDNASTDSTREIVKKFAPKVTLMASEKNLGFGRGNNLALERITTEFALLLNPDTVLSEDSISKMLEAAERYPEAAIISPMLYHENGKLQQSYKTTVFEREKHKATYIEPEGDLCAECLSGAVMLLRMSCFKNGFFDENIFLFYEDDDLCLQARAAGYSLVLTPESKIMHMMGRSSPPTMKYIYIKNWHMMWSRLYLEKKYYSAYNSRILAMKNFYIYAFKTIAYFAAMNKEKTVRSWARANASISFLLGKTA